MKHTISSSLPNADDASHEAIWYLCLMFEQMVETTALEAAKSPDPKSGDFPLTLRLDKMGISTQMITLS